MRSARGTKRRVSAGSRSGAGRVLCAGCRGKADRGGKEGGRRDAEEKKGVWGGAIGPCGMFVRGLKSAALMLSRAGGRRRIAEGRKGNGESRRRRGGWRRGEERRKGCCAAVGEAKQEGAGLAGAVVVGVGGGAGFDVIVVAGEGVVDGGEDFGQQRDRSEAGALGVEGGERVNE